MKRLHVYGLASILRDSGSKRARAVRRRILRALKRGNRARQERLAHEP